MVTTYVIVRAEAPEVMWESFACLQGQEVDFAALGALIRESDLLATDEYRHASAQGRYFLATVRCGAGRARLQLNQDARGFFQQCNKNASPGDWRIHIWYRPLSSERITIEVRQYRAGGKNTVWWGVVIPPTDGCYVLERFEEALVTQALAEMG